MVIPIHRAEAKVAPLLTQLTALQSEVARLRETLGSVDKTLNSLSSNYQCNCCVSNDKITLKASKLARKALEGKSFSTSPVALPGTPPLAPSKD